MPNSAPNRPLELSQKLYQHLLAAYPRPHREEYGGAMAQLFRDQCRDAWNDHRFWGLMKVWLRTLPDLVKTSFFERCTTFNPGKFMSDKLSFFFRLRHSPSFTFWTVFIVVFLLVFSAAVVLTFILPETYASTCRIKVETEPANAGYTTGGQPDQQVIYDPFFIQTTFEVIQSQVVLSNVVSRLNLNVVWGKKYADGETLKTTETMELLRKRMDLKPVRNTKLVAITVYSDDKQEAANLANAIADAYADYRVALRRQLVIGGLKALEQELKDYEGKIQAASTNVDYQRGKLHILDNDPATVNPTPTLTEQVMQTYNQQLIEGKKLYDSLQAQVDELKAMDKSKLRNVLPTVTGDASLSDLLGKLSTAEQSLSTLTNSYSQGNPKVTDCRTLIATLNQQIDDRVTGILAGLQSEVASKRAALASLTASVEQAKANDQLELEQGRPYWDAKRTLEQLIDFKKILATKIEEEKMNVDVPKDSLVQIIDTAEPGAAPVKPNKVLNIVTGAIIGIFLGGVSGSIAAFIVMRMEKRRNRSVSGLAA